MAFFSTIGAAVFGAIGLSTFAATSIGVVLSTAIGGALVGAAIGGLSAAIMGGDIGQGLLWGGVGGLAMGALSGVLNVGVGNLISNPMGNLAGSAQSIAGGGVSAVSEAGRFSVYGADGVKIGTAASAVAPGGGSILPAASKGITTAVTAGNTVAKSSMLSKMMDSEVVAAIGGAALSGYAAQLAQEDKSESDMEILKANQAHQATEADKDRSLAKDLKAMEYHPPDHFSEELAEDMRQFDETLGFQRQQYTDERLLAKQSRERSGAALGAGADSIKPASNMDYEGGVFSQILRRNQDNVLTAQGSGNQVQMADVGTTQQAPATQGGTGIISGTTGTVNSGTPEYIPLERPDEEEEIVA